MKREVFDVFVAGENEGKNRPHVVILPLGSTQCLVVSSYSAGNPWVENKIRALTSPPFGYQRDQVVTTLDNSKCIATHRNGWGCESHWLVYQASYLSRKSVEQSDRIGQMSQDGYDAICECLLRLSDVSPDRFDATVIARLKK